MSGCAECDRLRGLLAEAEADRDAWRGLAESDASAEVESLRVADWQAVLNAPPRAVVVLIWLADRPGRVLRPETAWALTRAAPCALRDRDDDDRSRVTVNVAMWSARTALRNAGLTVSIETIKGVGYRMDAASAAALKAFVGEAAHDA